MHLIMPADPVAPNIQVLDTENRLLATLQPQITVGDPAVLDIRDGKLVPRQVGVTRLTVSAGDKSAQSIVTVVRALKNEPLLLSDGGRINYALTQGNYEVEVKVRSGSSAYGVTLSWVGGRHCENKGEAQEITARCTIDTAGALIIENPTSFGLGPSADGYLALYEVP